MITLLSGGSRGGARGGPGPPLFLDQTEARRAENFFWRPPPLPRLCLRVWMTVPPLPPYLKVWIRHCAASYDNSCLIFVVLVCTSCF